MPQFTIVETSCNFAKANLDSLNHSVINADGSRQAPPYRHHVDDAMYGDIAEYVLRGLAASKIGLYRVLGFPTLKQPDSFSDTKCNTQFTHQRRMLGRLIDTRRMTVSLPDDRHTAIVGDLDKWSNSRDFTLLEASSIFGSISSICDTAIWGKTYLYTIQNLLSRAIQSAYRSYCTIRRLKKTTDAITSVLSPRLLSRLQPLVARHVARAIYHSRTWIRITAAVADQFHAIADYLRDPSNPWESPIGHLIPRDPVADLKSDASETRIGFQCEKFRFYGVILLSTTTYRCCFLDKGDPAKIHINQLELIGAILGLAATITLLEHPDSHHCPDTHRLIVAVPPNPQLAMGEDNQVTRSWTAKNAAKSEAGQRFLRIYSALLRDHDISPVPYWLPSDIPLNATDTILGSFPPVTRPLIHNTVQAIQQQQGGASKTAKELGTLRSRRIHCLMLLHALKLDDDHLLERASTDRRNWTCCILIFILLTNWTIKHELISLKMAELYIAAYASLCALVTDIDIRRERQTNKDFCRPYNHLRKEQKRWENDPRRKEPWETSHQRNLDTHVAQTSTHPDSLEAAIADWFAVGLYTGIRKSEWAQPDNKDWHPHTFLREDPYSALPRAFTRRDICFLSHQKAPLNLAALLAMSEDDAIKLIGQQGIRWRTQKNRHCNQEIMFTPNMKSPDLCCVRHSLQILKRHERLAANPSADTPLSLYRHTDGSTRNITTKNIKSVMRHTIARWANLDPSNTKHKKTLQDWASHSLRMGATNLLYASKFSGHQIQIILRWDSLAFMDYFRNLAIISDEQNDAITAILDGNNIQMENLF